MDNLGLGMKLDGKTLVKVRAKNNIAVCPYCNKPNEVNTFYLNRLCNHVMLVSRDKQGDFIEFGKLTN